ncbi:hypothetical protein [Pectinatus frisingensis]|uniref:hypothetical protein n=1 Tax=Pectinatus frisingensis TaxID=865 RepID=UPI003D80220F
MSTIQPFREFELSLVLGDQLQRMNAKIEELSNDEIMANNSNILADNFYEELKVIPIEIGDEESYYRSLKPGKIKRHIDPFLGGMDRREYIDVDGFTAKFYFHYTGDSNLFKCRASTFSLSSYPSFDIDEEHQLIYFTYQRSLPEFNSEKDMKQLLQLLKRDITSIKQGLEYTTNDVNNFNNRLHQEILNAIQNKRNKVQQFYSMSALLKIPLKKSDFAKTYIPLQKKIIPTAKKFNNEESYCISDADYFDVIKIIKHTGSTFERTPITYKRMHEEDLRNILLTTLNGMYLGKATGETFRNHGKTDICIEDKNRAAFVAECKIWTGQATLQNTFEQLDSYLTWRDCKTAIIYFVRNKDFVNILDKAKETIKNLQSIRHLKLLDKNEFECSMVSECNTGQLVTVRVIFFNLYAE